MLLPVPEREWAATASGVVFSTVRAMSTLSPTSLASSLSTPTAGGGALLGYARVSTAGQDPRMQHDALTAVGCVRTWTDVASGVSVPRPQPSVATPGPGTSWSSGAWTAWAASGPRWGAWASTGAPPGGGYPR